MPLLSGIITNVAQNLINMKVEIKVARETKNRRSDNKRFAGKNVCQKLLRYPENTLHDINSTIQPCRITWTLGLYFLGLLAYL